MTYGYVRVSTTHQNEGRQIEVMKKHNVEVIFSEKVSGKNTKDRPELQKLLKVLKPNDTVIVESYSRLARSTQDLLKLTDTFNEIGIDFISDKEAIDTKTPQGRLMLTFFAGLSQFERECTLERQREGIALAKAEGKYKGRQPIKMPKDFPKIYQRWQDKELTAVEAMKILELKKNTFYRMVKTYEEEQQINKQ